MPYSKYRELDHSQQQIRLLNLEPGGWHEPISATLSPAYLGDRPRYEALSYVWGEGRVGETHLDITMDGEIVPVTINLYAALRRLRGRHKAMVLWVDALCINQGDDTEKSYQVRLMTDIFEHASYCLAWLGEFEQDVFLGQDMTLDDYRRGGVTMDQADAQRALNFVENLSRLSTDGHFTADDTNVPAGWVSVSQLEVTAMKKLMSLKFFDRIWTVQEFIMPTHVALVLGAIRCDKSFEALVSKPEQDLWKHDPLYGGCCKATVAKLPDLPALILDFVENTVALRHMHNRELPLHMVSNHFRNRKSKDPRDKMFGLLGLTDPKTRQLVNYKLNKKQVYIECVRYELGSTHSLCPLMRLPETDRDEGLPSWVPSLEAEAPQSHGRNRMLLSLENKYLFYCDLLFSAGTQRSMELGSCKDDDSELRLGGRRVDSVRHVFQKPAQHLWHTQEGSIQRLRLREEWHGVLKSDPHLDLKNYPTVGGNYTDAFYRTFTCDTLVPMDRNSMRRVRAEDGEIITKGLAEHGYAVRSGLLPAKTLFITRRGYIGIGPEDTRVGDVVYVLFGGALPFLLREIAESPVRKGSHTFVGHTYVHGIMDGEVLQADIQDEELIIV